LLPVTEGRGLPSSSMTILISKLPWAPWITMTPSAGSMQAEHAQAVHAGSLVMRDKQAVQAVQDCQDISGTLKYRRHTNATGVRQLQRGMAMALTYVGAASYLGQWDGGRQQWLGLPAGTVHAPHDTRTLHANQRHCTAACRCLNPRGAGQNPALLYHMRCWRLCSTVRLLCHHD
jgi:hypothetical protein